MEPSLEAIDVSVMIFIIGKINILNFQPVPLHRENFPVQSSSPDFMDWDDEDSDHELGPLFLVLRISTGLIYSLETPAAQVSKPASSTYPGLSSSLTPKTATSAPHSSAKASVIVVTPKLPTAAAGPPLADAEVGATALTASSHVATTGISPETQAVSSHDSRVAPGTSKPAMARAGMHPSYAVNFIANLLPVLVLPRPATSERTDKKIRGLAEYMGYYLSSGDSSLQEPPHYKDAQLGDVFLHSFEDDNFQIWMRMDSGKWESIRPGQAHPYLQGYQLLLKNGKPTWVTGRTIATYHYRR